MRDDTTINEAEVAIFERLLLATPDDENSLRYLVRAYRELGREDDYARVVVALVKRYTSQAQFSDAVSLLPDLRCLPSTPEVEMLIQRVSLFADLNESVAPVAESEVPQGGASMPAIAMPVVPVVEADPNQVEMQAHAEQEIDFVMTWRARGWIDDALAQKLKAHLNVTAANQSQAHDTVSALSALHEIDATQVDRILAKIAREHTMPMIPLEALAPKVPARELLDADFMRSHGVAAFGMVDQLLMVGIMNPQNLRLQRAVKSLAQRECLFYLVHPHDFEPWINAE